MKKETNKYTFTVIIRSLKKRNVIKKNGIWHKWPLNISETYTFFSILLHPSW